MPVDVTEEGRQCQKTFHSSKYHFILNISQSSLASTVLISNFKILVVMLYTMLDQENWLIIFPPGERGLGWPDKELLLTKSVKTLYLWYL